MKGEVEKGEVERGYNKGLEGGVIKGRGLGWKEKEL